MKRNLGSSHNSMYATLSGKRHSEIYPPITTGMSHCQFFNSIYTRPKDFSKKCGQSSHEYGGKIPGLRMPDKKRKFRRQTANNTAFI